MHKCKVSRKYSDPDDDQNAEIENDRSATITPSTTDHNTTKHSPSITEPILTRSKSRQLRFEEEKDETTNTANFVEKAKEHEANKIYNVSLNDRR